MCNPELHDFMVEQGYEYFQYNTWNGDLMKNLEAQQLQLIRQGRKRNVLIITDDLVLNHDDKVSLEHLCCRGRHFHVSVLMLSVSYSNFPKTCRRSCDFIFLFSLGCQSDRELLLTEFSHKKATAEYYMSAICKEPYTCCVLNLNEKEQTVYKYRAPYSTTPPVEIHQENNVHEHTQSQSQPSENVLQNDQDNCASDEHGT